MVKQEICVQNVMDLRGYKMDLYNIELTGDSGYVGGFSYTNTYLVVSDNIQEAVSKTINYMKKEKGLDNIQVLKVEFVSSGIIV